VLGKNFDDHLNNLTRVLDRFKKYNLKLKLKKCIVLGVLILMIAAFGCCGAYKENYCCIMIFAVILIIIFICELAAGIAGFIYKDKVDTEVRLDD
jgi:hypothetical protein